MGRNIHGRTYEETTKGARLKPCAPHDILARLGDKWSILTLSLLAITPEYRLRFSAIKYGIEGITQRMLTLTLRHLERDGLIVRYYYPEIPPRVEYELTELGKDILPALESFTGWIRNNWPKIEAARLNYDLTARKSKI